MYKCRGEAIGPPFSFDWLKHSMCYLYLLYFLGYITLGKTPPRPQRYLNNDRSSQLF